MVSRRRFTSKMPSGFYGRLGLWKWQICQYTKQTEYKKTCRVRPHVEKEAFLYVKIYHLANYLGIVAFENLKKDTAIGTATVASINCVLNLKLFSLLTTVV